MERRQLRGSEIVLLQHAVQRYVRSGIEHAKVLERVAKSGGNPLMSPEACQALAEDHRWDARQAQALGDLLDQASEVELRGEEFVVDEEPEEDEE